MESLKGSVFIIVGPLCDSEISEISVHVNSTEISETEQVSSGAKFRSWPEDQLS
jgi:hypothetical protein